MKNTEKNRFLDKDKLINETTPFAIVESYKTARTNLLYSGSNDDVPIFAMTSAGPNEGKTINSLNLAISFSQMNKKVLIMDCDLRNPSIHRLLGYKNDSGISEILAGIESKISIKSTNYENLSVATAGRTPPNPSELLLSVRMKTLLMQFKEKFDYIFIDLPPIGLVTDAALLTDTVTGYILIARADKSDIRNVKNAVSILENVSANILGFILNDINPKRSQKYNYDYKYGYDYKY